MDVVPPPSNPYVGRLASLIASAKTQPSSFSGSRSELDKLANMVVTGSQCIIFDDTKKTCAVNSFSESVGRLDNIRFVDVVVVYEYPYQSKRYLLLMRTPLHVSELPLNLIPPSSFEKVG